MKVGFDTLGKYDIGFPLSRAAPKIFTLCDAFLKKEDALPAAARTVYTEDIRALSTQSGSLLNLKAGGESRRVLSSEEVKALDKKSVALVKKIHRTMEYEFGDTPAKAAEWGFDIKQTGKRTGTILMPDGRAAIVALLDRYAATEKARPAAERFKSPALAEVVAVADGLKQNVGARGTGKGQRASGTQQINTLAARLLDLLQAAAVQIIVKQYAGQVTPDLAQWGFEVAARQPSAKKAVKKATTA